jgi:hypothetical protein
MAVTAVPSELVHGMVTVSRHEGEIPGYWKRYVAIMTRIEKRINVAILDVWSLQDFVEPRMHDEIVPKRRQG